MAWESLSKTLATKPRVLAGPMLRKVTGKSVTVWVALRKRATVTLKVLDAAGALLQEGDRRTVAVGTNLHLVAVTATPRPPMADLAEGVIYQYDLDFAFDDLSQSLAAATDNAALSYAPFTRPSFCLPPKDPNQLRLIHGSCRMPHGNGDDTLDLVDDLIRQAAVDPLTRPHQILLTGDQIYADDVAASMLVMLSDASDVLLGWKEVLPVPARYQGVDTGSKLAPFMRRELLRDSGFTSEDLDAHLMTVGEYLCMYLFVWSDVLWTRTTLPQFADVVAAVRAAMEVERLPPGVLPPGDLITGHIRGLTGFRDAVPKVRRMLANIPSYMIFDDHEATDDWNMTRDICRGLYGNALGVRVVQNALVAYALCQHWGNAPEQFEDAGQALPGLTLLNLLDNGNAAHYEANSAAILRRVGVHDDQALRARPDNAVFHDANALTYNYTVEGPGHQVIFTDTRTWRTFPRGGGEAPELLPKDQIQQQIVNTPATGERALLVVVSTNAPPVQPIRSAARHSTIANAAAHFPDVFEAWELATADLRTRSSEPTDRLFKAISDKLPLVAGERRGRAILLSGDVHMSFASRLLYKGTSRFEDPPAAPQPVTAVFAQLVASSLKKQTDQTIGFHREGYRFAPFGTRWLIPRHIPESYAGWNLPVGIKKKVGERIYVAGRSVASVDLVLDRPTTVPLSEENIAVRASLPPDYGYRLDYLLANSEGVVPNPLPPIPPIPAGATAADRKRAAEAYHAATGSYRAYNKSNTTTRQVVGRNSVSEITFDWGAGDNKKVHHTVRWRDGVTPLLWFTTYTVSLDPNDALFPLSKP